MSSVTTRHEITSAVVAILTAVLVASPVLADSADFLTKAQAWYDKNCTKKNVNQQKSLLCYVFDKVQEQDAQLVSLTERVAALEGTMTPSPAPPITPSPPPPGGS